MDSFTVTELPQRDDFLELSVIVVRVGVENPLPQFFEFTG